MVQSKSAIDNPSSGLPVASHTTVEVTIVAYTRHEIVFAIVRACVSITPQNKNPFRCCGKGSNLQETSAN